MADSIEQIMKRIHLLFARCKQYQDKEDIILVPKQKLFALLQELNYAVSELMDDYEATQRSRELALKRFQQQKEEIEEESIRVSEDIYAASMLYTDRLLMDLRTVVEKAGRDIRKEYEFLASQLESQAAMLGENQAEVRGQLGALNQGQKYKEIIAKYNERIAEEELERQQIEKERQRQEQEEQEQQRQEEQLKEQGQQQKEQEQQRQGQQRGQEGQEQQRQEQQREQEGQEQQRQERQEQQKQKGQEQQRQEEQEQRKQERLQGLRRYQEGRLTEEFTSDAKEPEVIVVSEWKQRGEKQSDRIKRDERKSNTTVTVEIQKPTGGEAAEQVRVRKRAVVENTQNQTTSEARPPIQKIASIVDESALDPIGGFEDFDKPPKIAAYEIKVNESWNSAMGEIGTGLSSEDLDAEYYQWKSSQENEQDIIKGRNGNNTKQRKEKKFPFGRKR